MAPTLLDVAGVPVPEGKVSPQPVVPDEPLPWPGRSLVPILEGGEDSRSGQALVEDDQDNLGIRLRTLVTDRYRLTAYSDQTYGELFDLHEDPSELRNRWDDPAYQGIRDELRLALLDKIMSTDYALPRRWGGS